HKGSDHDHKRCKVEQKLISVFVDQRLLQQKFDYIGQRLSSAPFTNTHRAEALLNHGTYFSFRIHQHQSQQGKQQHERNPHQHHFQYHHCSRLKPCRQSFVDGACEVGKV